MAGADWGQEDGPTPILRAHPPPAAGQASWSALHRPCRALGQSGPSQDPSWGPRSGQQGLLQSWGGQGCPPPSRTCTRSIGSSLSPTWDSPCVPGPHEELWFWSLLITLGSAELVGPGGSPQGEGGLVSRLTPTPPGQAPAAALCPMPSSAPSRPRGTCTRWSSTSSGRRGHGRSSRSTAWAAG